MEMHEASHSLEGMHRNKAGNLFSVFNDQLQLAHTATDTEGYSVSRELRRQTSALFAYSP